MYSKVLIATTLMAATASASNFMAHAEMKREILQPRQTDGSLTTECQTALLDVYSSLPSPPPEIVSDLSEHPQTDPCSFSTPASLSKEYASYSSEVVSWYSANQDEISSALSECPILSQYATIVPVCATDGGDSGNSKPATGVASKTSESGSKATDSSDESSSSGSGSKATGSGSGSSATGSGSGSTATGTEVAAATKTDNAGHRETGMALAAIAVVGAVLAL